MSPHITVKETIPVRGTCPMDGQTTEIDVTYQKYHPLGSQCTYAVVTGIDCDEIDNGCPVDQCPIAYSRVYW